MANPQPDKFTRISNELYEAIMQTDFSKRQRCIIDLIMRASYGCGKKFAILKLSDFEVVGVYKTHVKKELEYLAKTKVIYIDGERIFLNKDYEQWRVSLNKTSDSEKLGEILRRNLSSEITKTVTKVTKTVTDEGQGGYQNSNLEVTKTVTLQPEPDQQTSASEGCLKKSKENICSSSSIDKEQEKIVKYYSNNFSPVPNPKHVEVLLSFYKDGMEADLIIWAMEKAIMANARRLDYVLATLKNLFTEGITTLSGAKLAEEEFKKRKKNIGRNPPFRKGGVSNANERDGPGKYAELYE